MGFLAERLRFLSSTPHLRIPWFPDEGTGLVTKLTGIGLGPRSKPCGFRVQILAQRVPVVPQKLFGHI